MNIALVTIDRLLEMDSTNLHVLKEDGLLRDALEQRGCLVDRISWEGDHNWSTYEAVIIRSTWNYHEKYYDFLSWIALVSTQTQLINPPNLLLWNADKRYLLDLEKQNIPVIPTVFFQKGAAAHLQELFPEESTLVVKPVVSASSMDTFKVQKSEEDQRLFQTLLEKQDMMVQPYLRSIETDGEYSLIYFNGVYSHAVQKINTTGDFRVQQEFGGVLHNITPEAGWVSIADNAIQACLCVPVYARIDMVRDNSGNRCISEIELVEPEMWMQRRPISAQYFAESICNQISSV